MYSKFTTKVVITGQPDQVEAVIQRARAILPVIELGKTTPIAHGQARFTLRLAAIQIAPETDDAQTT